MQIVILSLADPNSHPSGATLRIRTMAEALKAAGHFVQHAFPRTSATGDAEGSEGVGTSRGEASMPDLLRRTKRHLMPMPTAAGARNPALAAQLQALDPDLLVLTAISQAGFRRAVPRAQVWLDFLDLWSTFAIRELESRSGVANVTTRVQAAFLKRAETRLGRTAEVVTAVGWGDYRELRVRGVAAEWLPVTMAPVKARPRGSAPQQAAGLLGNFRYWPNQDAYNRFARVWAPKLANHGIQSIVAGVGAEHLPPSQHIRNLGQVEEVGSFYDQVSWTVAPLALGGGMKIKVIESLAHGVPVIASRHAVEGLPADVASLARLVDLERPDFHGVLAMGLPDDITQRLAPFTSEHMNERVAHLAAQLSSSR
jgi:hypothetical protein